MFFGAFTGHLGGFGWFGWFGWFGFQPQGLQRQCESEADLKSNVWPRQARRGSEREASMERWW